MTTATFISLSCMSLDTRFLRLPFRFVSSLCFGDLLETSWKMSKNLLLNSLCNGSQNTFEENQEKRLTRSRFSYSFSPHDMKSFTVEEEEEKERKDGTEECSPRRVLEDCSVSTESKTSSCISNRYESETTSPWRRRLC